ncbi:FAD:protein FMN transferase [Flavihumibacter fluvii]|uniref:FAD:protein FMN transferase n=1 Tax=Flavihumibacter fluvii TaxID=2838157 RepID=UPI001BDDD53E|nr:FAD:protein FMN transferase [Flavihumibacter fluvii]ULQ52729.1 FAD:protein FMN transferase [Flavihumibacter fluvii]
MKLLACIGFFYLVIGQPPMKSFFITGEAQGTTYHISYYATDSLVSRTAIEHIFSQVDSSLSIYKPYSLISRFNRSEKGIQMDTHLETVVRKSLEIYRATDGISDLTVLPLVNAWGFGPSKPLNPPDSASILNILPCIGAGKLYIKGNWLQKELPCMQIDLNGIAQGYTVDLLADYLESKNISNYLVEVGGEIRLKGKKYPSGDPMKLGIEAPSNEALQQTIIYKVIQPPAGAITTSGNYRKFHMSGGKRVSHLIDPKSGYPFSNELISVTVYAKKAIIADGYDNALMGMGLAKALRFMEKQRDMEAYFIYRKTDGTIGDSATMGFYKLF